MKSFEVTLLGLYNIWGFLVLFSNMILSSRRFRHYDFSPMNFWVRTDLDRLRHLRVRSSHSGSPFRCGILHMAASSSKARAKPIPRDPSSSEDSSQEVLIDANIAPRQHSLLPPRLPRLHSIKGPFRLVLGGILTHPKKSKTRKTDFKLIERLPDTLRGQFRFDRQPDPVCRPLRLQAGMSATGAWRKVYTSPEYPRLVFKLSQATEDSSYTTEEIRAFRQVPDYTAQFIQGFHANLTLSEDDGPPGKIGTIRDVSFHIVICERLIPFDRADLTGLDSEEIAYRLALAIAVASKRGFRLRDCGRGNWGFGLRNGRIVPLYFWMAIRGRDWKPPMSSIGQMAPQKTHWFFLAVAF